MPKVILQSHIDSTMMGTFRSCPQKFFNEFVLGLRPAETSIDLHAGATFSTTLERFYREVYNNGCNVPTALGRAHETFLKEWGDFVIRKEKHPKTPENMWAAVESYVGTYPPRTDPCQPYFTDGAPSFEYTFAIPLDFPGFPHHPNGDPFVYVGRFDMFGRWNGRPVVRDEKTAQRLESNWAEKWDLRSQFLGYCWALQHNGIPCDTAVIRGVIITTKEVRQVEAIKIYPQFLIDRWFEQLRRDLVRLVEMWHRYADNIAKDHSSPHEAFDFNLGESCTIYNHCAFIPLCSSPDPENWYSNYVEKRWNPLMRDPIAELQSSIPPLANRVLTGTEPKSPLKESATTSSG